MSDYRYGILLQGRVSGWLKDIIIEYKANFPHAQIVLSTWNTENVDGIDCEIIQSKLPLPTHPHNSTINYQIIGMKAGLKKINSEIVLKCRTDQFIHNKKIFELYENNCAPEKIMTSDVGSVIDDDYRLSDFCQIAKKEVLENFWNNIQLYDGKYTISPEIYLAKNYVVNIMNDHDPWEQAITKYFHIMKYHSDFQIEFEKLDRHEEYLRHYDKNKHVEEIENVKFIIKSHFFQSQKSRIEFSQKYTNGKVLFSSHGINMQYACSKVLLDSGCKEIWHRHNFDSNLSSRKINSENNIDYESKIDIKAVTEKSFDCILSFEEIQFHKDPDSLIKNYKKMLKPDGVLIISTSNQDSDNITKKDEIEVSGFSREKIIKIIESVFPISDKFSQGDISEDRLGNMVFEGGFYNMKKLAKKIFDKFDRKTVFYKSYLQSSALRLREKKYEKMRIDFKPIPLKKEHNPLYFLIICKKAT